MGGCSFEYVQKGKSAQDAFTIAVEQMIWEYGHSGYSGTLKEKSGFIEFKPSSPMTEKDVDELLQLFFGAHWENNQEDTAKIEKYFGVKTKQLLKTYSEKWGPAICIPVEDNKYYFAGIASCQEKQ